MKSAYYSLFVLIFLISACTQTETISQTSKTAQEEMPSKSILPDLPAPIPANAGQEYQITLENYPTSAENLIIDKRLNNEKMELVKEWAPDDVEKEIALYNAEFGRKGIDLENIRYKVSIVDGKSWVLYPYNRRTGEGYIVSIDGVIRASIDLFGYLDRSPDDDFFDLIPVNIDKAEVVGDTSGWHVFAKIQNGQIIQWYDATHDRVETIEIEPTPSPTPEEIVLKNTINLKDGPKFENFSRVTLDDFTSGKLLGVEKKWLNENPFSEEAIPFTDIKFLEVPTGLKENVASEPYYEIDTKNIYILPRVDYSDPETRPIKIISFYVLWDENLFRKLGYTDNVFAENARYGVKKKYEFARLGIMSWAWLNPDGSTVIGHSLIDFSSSKILDDINKIIPMPLIDVYNYKENIPNKIITDVKAILEIYNLYPELKPSDLASQWVETGIMPKETENILFGLAPATTKW